VADSADTATLLSHVDLFAGLSGRQLKRLADLSKEVRHDPGHEVTTEGALGLGFHLILDGEATVTQGGAVLRRLGPGDHFGEISMIDGKRRSATVTAETPLRTVTVSHATFVELLDQEPAFARTLLTVLCARLREAEQREAAPAS
jgi:CRP/FNR family transcriptional regulator, cyclic AMP receptor protein